MAELPALVKDLALILVVAGVVTLLFKRLKQPLVLGYIVAGFLVSPHMPYTMSVVDRADVQTWADIGVIFLLFSLGLDFSFKKILKMGLAPVIAAITIIASMMMLGVSVGKLFGWSQMNCIFLAGMLAMSSTTIIYKAFDDMGLRQQQFAGLVMSVLILEDILAIVMMVMLSSVAGNPSNLPSGEAIAGAVPAEGGITGVGGAVLRIAFFLILWFVVGIALIPLFLRSVRKLITEETLLVVSLGLCCLMAWISTTVGFSSAFGAFIMGSILAETVEADKIIKIVEPVKNLFGAIFFVSVGMLVDPEILVDYALPIIALVLTILIGQAVFGSFGYLLSGQNLKTAMRCGFSMAQIGEFAFIIASLGLSLGVVSEFLYPVVVAVSVITTFLTPYMIRASQPCYNFLECKLPPQVIAILNHITLSHPTKTTNNSLWHTLLRKLLMITGIYSILCVFIITFSLMVLKPFIAHLMPEYPNTANAISLIITLLLLAPFLRAMVAKKNRSEEFKALWQGSFFNHLALILTIVVRAMIAWVFILFVCASMMDYKIGLVAAVAVVVLVLILASRRIKSQSRRLEDMFLLNLRSREIEARVHGRKRPLYENKLLDRDVHLADFDIPQGSLWAGKTLQQLGLRQRFGVQVSSILRANTRINIPDGNTVLFPGDRIQVIGTDIQLSDLANVIAIEIMQEDTEVERREMRLRQIVLGPDSHFIGKTVQQSGIRDQYNCLIVGFEEGEENLTPITPDRLFAEGDILWIVGELQSLDRLTQND